MDFHDVDNRSSMIGLSTNGRLKSSSRHMGNDPPGQKVYPGLPRLSLDKTDVQRVPATKDCPAEQSQNLQAFWCIQRYTISIPAMLRACIQLSD